jgi:hypothetical protein
MCFRRLNDARVDFFGESASCHQAIAYTSSAAAHYSHRLDKVAQECGWTIGSRIVNVAIGVPPENKILGSFGRPLERLILFAVMSAAVERGAPWRTSAYLRSALRRVP